MGNLSNGITYSCFEDCRMEGCPSHKMEVSIQTTSEIMEVKIDGEQIFITDPSAWKALKQILKYFDYNHFDLS